MFGNTKCKRPTNAADLNVDPPTGRATSPPRRVPTQNCRAAPPPTPSLSILLLFPSSAPLPLHLPYPLPARAYTTPRAHYLCNYTSAHSPRLPRLVSFPTLISAHAVESSRCHPPSARTRTRRELDARAVCAASASRPYAQLPCRAAIFACACARTILTGFGFARNRHPFPPTPSLSIFPAISSPPHRFAPFSAPHPPVGTRPVPPYVRT
ncbi:hypothetical protein B0H16DRAFT_1735897 [Mycena metata]|uniref:Uncharacterized protein n=1 Tax=Mycena metata TaxID=1033252 RepID=A0AAD7HQJ0_9AGAR|nr:hypothetical protein B0H16DRAFT_1735897 [Mycena metata]